MAPHTITSAVGAQCHWKVKAGLRRSPRGFHTRLSSLLRLNVDSSLKRRPGSIPLQSSFLVRGTTPNGGVKGSTRNGRLDPKCPSARRLRMVQDTGAPNEGVTCAWMAADEAVGCTRVFLTKWRCLDDWSAEGVLSLVFV
ncbi:uncharacterized protein TNCV_2189491 [Trichonephila clavipes]|nr:uncharacterized protein TNCV_2189491 [Trichonephila clavipes]